MLPTWGYYVNETTVLNVDNARGYGRWLGARYKDAPNIVWVNGGDRIPTGCEDVYRALARGLREGDGGAHLITYHPCGWRSSAQFFHGDDWLDFNMIETWTEWAKVYPAVLADALLRPPSRWCWARGPTRTAPSTRWGRSRRSSSGARPGGPSWPAGSSPTARTRCGAWSRAGTTTFDTPGAAHVCLMKRILAGPWWDLRAGPGPLCQRRGQRAHAERRDALDGRRLGPDLPLQPQTVFLHLDKIGRRRQGHLDQPGHWRDSRTPAPTPPAT